MSYLPCLAEVVNLFAIRQVKQGTETTMFRIGYTLQSCQYVSSLFIIPLNGDFTNAVFCHNFTRKLNRSLETIKTTNYMKNLITLYNIHSQYHN